MQRFDTKKQIKAFKLPPVQVEQLRNYAEKNQISEAEIIRAALRAYFASQKVQENKDS
ncbi:ribbon-helix-helix protein, CopG family [Thermoleptolyngbya oregonensis NK1-22]|uniref:Ribbon-helix-helix protein, CopG family n=1 Tax=Thermoleptolyngbya oregonensis NK1-22 TaxID=2547457 RepID=A0AA96Y7C2_9CYAN|nr:CopG family transcriptional regulator [Thermoleptolyngbya oregonensis]WOB45495.1 ribbon-helix-helix protein, CopG family [Thermoleptolyngbya oregonensis NK1-22]